MLHACGPLPVDAGALKTPAGAVRLMEEPCMEHGGKEGRPEAAALGWPLQWGVPPATLATDAHLEAEA